MSYGGRFCRNLPEDFLMARETILPENINFVGIGAKKIHELTDQECLEMAAYFYDRYMWSSDDRRDLSKAAMYRHLATNRNHYAPYIYTKTVDHVMHLWGTPSPMGEPDLVKLAREEFPNAF